MHGIEVSVRNTGVALLLYTFFFVDNMEAQGHVLYTTLFYAGLSAFLAAPQVVSHRLGRSPVLFRRRFPRPDTELPEPDEER